MKATYVDTNRMREIGKEINALELEFEKEINAMFNRMINVPYDTREWTGAVAQKHSRLVALEKDDYMDFGKRIKKFGNKIIADADEYDQRVKLNDTEEHK